mmetsp:Transcript_654/g.2141  ORF Transcript_654/g.2141 Transcript_654/m.2141 type:complete len:204 (-) Transcript_654:754-1365(-)
MGRRLSGRAMASSGGESPLASSIIAANCATPIMPSPRPSTAPELPRRPRPPPAPNMDMRRRRTARGSRLAARSCLTSSSAGTPLSSMPCRASACGPVSTLLSTCRPGALTSASISSAPRSSKAPRGRLEGGRALSAALSSSRTSSTGLPSFSMAPSSSSCSCDSSASRGPSSPDRRWSESSVSVSAAREPGSAEDGMPSALPA